MLGCGLPVFTAAYPCISELVQDGVNGTHFSSSEQLGLQLAEALCGFPDRCHKLEALRSTVRGSDQGSRATWETEWQQVVKPLIC